jgi:hypothetical protein
MHARCRTPAWFLAGCAVLTLAVAAAAGAADLEGTVELLEHGAPAADLPNAVIYYEPEGRVSRPPPRSAEIVTFHKRFAPRVVTVTPGSQVRFPNQDPILHNVFSVTPGNRFDLGRYGDGEGRSATLKKPGLVRVYCNVHHAMVAYVMVLETPHVTAPDTAGRFALSGLPAGRGTLTVWHERAGTWSQPIQVPATAPLRIPMRVAVVREPPHLNKYGKPYDSDPRGTSYR